MHSGSLSGHAAPGRGGRPARQRPGGLLIAVLEACADTLRKVWSGAQGEVALTLRHPSVSRNALASQAPDCAFRLQLTYADAPLTPGATRVTATAAVLRADGTDITASLPPSAWTWRQACGLSMRAGYGAVTVDTEGQGRAVCVCPRGASVSLSGNSRAACQAMALGVEVTVVLGNGERLSQCFQPGLAGLE
ncbi:hypothetical protein [Cupriavidus sp. 8B]